MMTSVSSANVPRSGAAARIVRYCRLRAGLTQRTLAKRAGVTQETIARIESGRTEPRYKTVAHLVAACGFELEVEPKKGVGVDVPQIQQALARSATERAVFAEQAGYNVRELIRLSRRVAEEVSDP
jgi:transcriptional regulator with XRE-family HTH domain